MTQSAHILEGTTENFDRLVLENSKRGLVVVDFWAPWVGPSLRQQEILSDLVKTYDGRFLLVTVNTDEQKQLAERFGVKSLPSFKLFRHGNLVGEYHGIQPEADYPNIVETYVHKKLDEVSRQGIAAWQSGDPDQALQILARGVVENPQNLALPALMANILMRQERYHEAKELLTSLPETAQEAVEIRHLLAHADLIVTAQDVEEPNELVQRQQQEPENPELLYQLAAVHLLDDDIQSALDLLLKMVQQHATYRNGVARKSMSAVLDRMDSEDPQVARYRRELFRLNY
ncbi:MAG: tetratricopeptide repeat protein [Candidatus Thiodiazotropha sp. 6PLUC2]